MNAMNEKLRQAIEAAQNATPEVMRHETMHEAMERKPTPEEWNKETGELGHHTSTHEGCSCGCDPNYSQCGGCGCDVRQCICESTYADEELCSQPDMGGTDHEDRADVVDDVVAPSYQPAKLAHIKGLDEKAVLIQLKRRQYSPYKLDKDETDAYGAGNVNKHLFSGSDNRVKKAMSAYGEVYTFVKDNTVPWSTGIELLNINNYIDFTRELRALITKADAAVDDLVTHWNDEVAEDMARLTKIAQAKGKPSLANMDDYPSAEEMQGKWSIEVRYMPVPTTGDFRVNISDEDKATLQQQLDDAEKNASTHVIEQMLDPMRCAVEKLSVPIGVDGSVFRDSLIDNMVEVSERMNKVNISDDPVVQQQINDLRALVGVYASKKEALRQSQPFRADAKAKIDELMGRMKGLV
jgi:hypothetical protein